MYRTLNHVATLIALLAALPGCSQLWQPFLGPGACAQDPAGCPDGSDVSDGAGTPDGGTPLDDGGVVDDGGTPAAPDLGGPVGTGCIPGGFCWQNPLPQGNALIGNWARTADEGWAVGSYGALLKRSTTGWAVVSSGTTSHLRGVYAPTASIAFAVGDAGTILGLSGGTWKRMASTYSGNLYTLFGTSESDVWAAGDAGTLLHYDGSKWTQATSPTASRLEALWGSAPGDVYAVGAGGAILRYNGTAWSAQGSPTTQTLHGLWGVSSSQAYAVGDGPTALMWNGATWGGDTSGVSNATSDSLTTLWTSDVQSWSAPSATIGRLILRSGTWQSQTVSAAVARINHMHGIATTNVWGVGDEGLILRYTTGWGPESLGFHEPLGGGFALTATQAWAFGTQGTVYRWNGSLWASEKGGFTSPAAMFGLDSDYLWVAAGGALYRRRSGTWGVDTSTGRALTGIWGARTQQVFAVGVGGQVLRYDGTSWSPVALAVLQDLYAISGCSDSDVWAVGALGTILHYDGSAWNVVVSSEIGQARNLIAVHCTTDGALWVLRADGRAFRRSGSGWAGFDTGVASPRALWGPSKHELWVVGATGQIGGSAGGAFSTFQSIDHALSGVFGTAPGAGAATVWIVGSGGTILRK